MSQGFFKSTPANDHFDISSIGKKSTAIEAAQKAFGSVVLPSIIVIKDLIKVNKNPDYDASGDKENIAVKIARLRKKQKKAQIKIELSQLQE